jgi:hypothetical protein
MSHTSSDDFQPLGMERVEEQVVEDAKWTENDREDLDCSICTNPYHNAGPHQISSLKVESLLPCG